jgi:hypothetical protein
MITNENETNIMDEESAFLHKIIQEKEKANTLLKSKNNEEALSIYLSLIKDIENLDNSLIANEIKNQLVFICSNASLCYKNLSQLDKSANLDLKIIKTLDPEFTKSYARLIMTYLARNKFASANYWAKLMQSKFTTKTLSSFQDILDKVEEEKKKQKQQGIANFI